MWAQWTTRRSARYLWLFTGISMGARASLLLRSLPTISTNSSLSSTSSAPTYSIRVHLTTCQTMTDFLTFINETSLWWAHDCNIVTQHNNNQLDVGIARRSTCLYPRLDLATPLSSLYEANFSAYRNEILCVGANKYLYFLFSNPRGENTNSLCMILRFAT